ncbi:hypothetical protein [uncultured Mediterranean phage]|nr:hypothetical protein [uncultured Mediterranean phage]
MKKERLTNIFNLPTGVSNAVRNISSLYSKGDSDISMTGLIDSSLIKILQDKYKDQIKEDVSDRIWSVFGSAVHHIIEHSDTTENTIKEKRFFGESEGWKISGAIDRVILRNITAYENETIEIADIEDYKCTSVWSIIYPKDSWEKQTNGYAWLLRQNGYIVGNLSIIVLARDWQKSKADESKRNGGNYPPLPIHVVKIRKWSDEEQDAYIKDRVVTHQEADYIFNMHNEQIPCTNEERWKNPPTYAVKVKNKKRALKVFDLENDAQDYAKNISESYIETRPSIARRCKDYCNVKPFCEVARKEGYV